MARAVLTGNNALLVQNVHHRRALACLLVQRLLEQDGAGYVLAQTGGGHQQLAVCPPVVLSVLQANGVQALAAGGVRLVHSQDAVPRAGHLLLHAPTAMPQPKAVLMPGVSPAQGSPNRTATTLLSALAGETRTAVAMSSSSYAPARTTTAPRQTTALGCLVCTGFTPMKEDVLAIMVAAIFTAEDVERELFYATGQDEAVTLPSTLRFSLPQLGRSRIYSTGRLAEDLVYDAIWCCNVVRIVPADLGRWRTALNL